LGAEKSTQVRAFLGYSGWGGGQLEKELKQNIWIVTDVPADLLVHPQNDRCGDRCWV